MPKKKQDVVPVPADVALPRAKKIKADQGELGDVLTPGWAALEQGKFAKAERLARDVIAKEPLYLYAYSQLIDALAGKIAAGKTELRAEQRTLAWTLLALARRGVDDIHEEYWKLYRQKCATLLASIALVAPELVSLADAKRLIEEAAAVRVRKDDQMFMTGTWSLEAVAAELAKR